MGGTIGVVTDWLFFALVSCSEEVLSRVCRAGGQGPRLFKCIGALEVTRWEDKRERGREEEAGIHNRSPVDAFERMMSPYMYVCLIQSPNFSTLAYVKGVYDNESGVWQEQ